MSIVTRDSCARIHPALLPFLEQCLICKELNAQGGILEIKRPKPRLVATILCVPSTKDVLFCSAPLDSDDSGDCDRFIFGIPYCGVELDCERIP